MVRVLCPPCARSTCAGPYYHASEMLGSPVGYSAPLDARAAAKSMEAIIAEGEEAVRRRKAMEEEMAKRLAAKRKQ